MLPPVADSLLREVLARSSAPELDDNVDFVRFPEGLDPPPEPDAPRCLAELLRQGPPLQRLFEILNADDRELLIRVLSFRVLGHRRVRLPMTASRLRALVEQAHAMRTAEATGALGIYDWLADDYDLHALGYPINLRAYVGNVVQTFQLEQYRCPGVPEVGVRPGDVVIDGGSCFGDTALYFAHRTGPGGYVVAFEFEPGNLALLDHNLGANAELAERIDVHHRALWNRAGERLDFRAFGPATAVVEGGEGHVETEAIDALVERSVIPRLDFLKLDVEGAELNVLQGAEATLRRFRPRLALAAYHHDDDLAVLSSYVNDLGCDYRLRLGHTTMHAEETMLFASADEPR